MTDERKPSGLETLREYGADADLLGSSELRALLAAYANQRPDNLAALEKLQIVRRTDGGIELTERSKSLAMDLGLEPGTGLSLAGAGYRSMLFQLGVVWRMNTAGLLPKLDQIASVSTASVTAAWLGRQWLALEFGADGISKRLEEAVVRPIRRLATRTLDAGLAFSRMFSDPGRRFVDSLDKHLFQGATLGDLPDRPRFVLCATSFESGSSWRFAKAPAAPGSAPRRQERLALAAAASSAFPPFLGPMWLDSDSHLSDDAATRRPGSDDAKIGLVDGSLSDRFGLEPNWERYRNVYVSDGSPRPTRALTDKGSFVVQLGQTITLLENQGRQLWKRLLIEAYRRGDRGGAYWGIQSDLANYAPHLSFEIARERVTELAEIPSRLTAIEPELQERLINWGFVLTDAALRRHIVPNLPAPLGLPYPAAGV